MQIDLDKDLIQSLVVTRIVDSMEDRKDDIEEAVRIHLNNRINDILADRVDILIAETVNKLIEDGFNKEFQRVDSFGAPQGKKTTIAKELEHLVTGYWTEKVDKSGQPTTSSYRSTTRAEWLMTQICADNFSELVKQQVANVSGTFKDKLRAALRNELDALLSKVINVTSFDEQVEKSRPRK